MLIKKYTHDSLARMGIVSQMRNMPCLVVALSWPPALASRFVFSRHVENHLFHISPLKFVPFSLNHIGDLASIKIHANVSAETSHAI